MIVAAIFVLGFGGIGVWKLAFSSGATLCINRTFNQGSTGDCVASIQQLANWKTAVSSKLAIDGKYSATTTHAIKQLQSASPYGHVASGKVDSYKWDYLCQAYDPATGISNFDTMTYQAATNAGCYGGAGGK